MAKKQARKDQPKPPAEIFILTESSAAGVQKYGAEQSIPVEKLREHLRKFTAALSSALDSVGALAGDFRLTEVQVTATLSAEAGFVWVTKAGLEGGVTLTFTRRS